MQLFLCSATSRLPSEADKGAERDGKENHTRDPLTLKLRPRSFLWWSLYSTFIMDGILFCVWSCLVTGNEQGRTGCFPRACSWCARVSRSSFPDVPLSAAVIASPADAPSSQASHLGPFWSSARCPQHLCAAVLASPPVATQSLQPLQLNISSPSARYQPQTQPSTSESSLCGGLIFQLLQHCIQTDSPSLPH